MWFNPHIFANKSTVLSCLNHFKLQTAHCQIFSVFPADICNEHNDKAFCFTNPQPISELPFKEVFQKYISNSKLDFLSRRDYLLQMRSVSASFPTHSHHCKRTSENFHEIAFLLVSENQIGKGHFNFFCLFCFAGLVFFVKEKCCQNVY